jgi:TonB family protein
MQSKTTVLIAAILLAVNGDRVHAAPGGATPKLAVAIYAPQPKYPVGGGLWRPQGSGMFVMRVQIKSGRVKAVYVARSTGHAELDAAAVSALKKWRFKPDALPPIKKIRPHVNDPFAMEDSLVKEPVTFEVR